jgi:hypothetical protein
MPFQHVAGTPAYTVDGVHVVAGDGVMVGDVTTVVVGATVVVVGWEPVAAVAVVG